MDPSKRIEILCWDDVDKLIDHLIPQFNEEYSVMIMITKGGVVPGGLLSDALGIAEILTAAVDFPSEIQQETENQLTRWSAWPKFVQFPDQTLLRGRRVLIVDDVWGSGRTITAVKNRVVSLGGVPSTCVLHFNPHRNLFGTVRPDYFAATTDCHVVYPWELPRDKSPIR